MSNSMSVWLSVSLYSPFRWSCCQFLSGVLDIYDGNYLVDSQGPTRWRGKLNGSLLREGMGKISWKSRCLFLYDRHWLITLSVKSILFDSLVKVWSFYPTGGSSTFELRENFLSHPTVSLKCGPFYLTGGSFTSEFTENFLSHWTISLKCGPFYLTGGSSTSELTENFLSHWTVSLKRGIFYLTGGSSTSELNGELSLSLDNLFEMWSFLPFSLIRQSL